MTAVTFLFKTIILNLYIFSNPLKGDKWYQNRILSVVYADNKRSQLGIPFPSRNT